MNTVDLTIPQGDLLKLLSTAGGDVALLYLYIHSGNAPETAQQALDMTKTRFDCAAATLRQLGLWPEPKKVLIMGERPTYSEGDVLSAMDTDRDFRSVYGELQRLLGRSLNTEEMKIVLGFTRYLGLPADVICVLVCYCKDRARQQGKLRAPSLRTIEKEAYFWAESGIDTVEEAAAFIQNRNQQNSMLGQLLQKLQIRGRNLTPAEEKYARKWLAAGFNLEVLEMAYERTCLNTGGLNWNYMDKILTRWQEEGLMTPEQVKSGDKKKKQPPKGASGKLGAAEKENIRRLLQED
ncbi:MAG: DnaD domain protein [Oscillospiraceae bacterium]|nr:DnaD domain protein [Oscillospiraceae bacterium]